MDNVANRLFVLEGSGEVQLFEGTYSEYMEEAWEKAKTEKGAETSIAVSEGVTLGRDREEKQRKLSYMEKKEYKVVFQYISHFCVQRNDLWRYQLTLSQFCLRLQALEGEIEKLNGVKAELEALLEKESTSTDYGKLAKLSEKLASVDEAIEQKVSPYSFTS